ncbi:MAG: hypothetical protein FJ083_03745 [Cyanobacteria bacterium K_Offshore_surface_m2_239]|nr:hypothetical protein [Cyanobacteria bacterium K_Offshore_surface_m2_239]
MTFPLGALRSPGSAKLFICFVCLVYLLLIVPGPGTALPWLIVDDGLFFRWSSQIQQGNWLGPWDYLTTAKGPLHSLLVAWAADLGIGPFAYKRLLYLLGSLVFAFTVIRPGRPWLRLALLVALLADPFQFGPLGLRNLREGTYLPIQMTALGLGSLVLDRLRADVLRPARILLPMLAMAFAVGLLLITREGRLIVVSEMFVWLVLAALLLRNKQQWRLWRRASVSILLSFTLILLVPLLPIAILRSLHATHYGYPLSNSFEEGGFSRFFAKLSALRERGDQAYIPRVSVKKRTLILAAEELRDRPEGLRRILNGIDWSDGDYGCREYPDTCQDMASGWLVWALRKSIANQLVSPANEARFQAALSQLNREVDQLCSSSLRLECVNQSSGYSTPPTRWGFVNLQQEVAHETAAIFAKVFVPQLFPFGRPDLAKHTWKGPMAPADLQRLRLPEQIPLSEQVFWQRLYVGISIIGFLMRWLLLVLALLSLTLFRQRQLVKASLDPVAAWLLSCSLIHSAIYVLIGLVSFSGAPYTLLAAPIAVGFYSRLIRETLSDKAIGPPPQSLKPIT